MKQITRTRRRRGFTLIEVMAATLVLGMTVLTTLGMFSSSAIMRERSGGYSRAASIAQRKLEEIRNLSASKINYAGLLAADIIDTGSTQPYSFTQEEQLGQEFPGGTGTIQITDAGTDLVRVDLTIRWNATRNKQFELSASTLVASKEVWLEQ
jgi:prepilin-type N-terminal cleavage/methylation domain-containing protein